MHYFESLYRFQAILRKIYELAIESKAFKWYVIIENLQNSNFSHSHEEFSGETTWPNPI